MRHSFAALALLACTFAAPAAFAEDALTVSPAAVSASPAPYWNGDTNYPLIYREGSSVWYISQNSARITANDASSLVFSVSLFRVDTEKDPSAYEFSRFWFRKPQSSDKYAIYVRNGEMGAWVPRRLDETAPDTEGLRSIFLAGWEAATGFPYDSSL